MATENLKVKITADASQAKAEIGKFKAVLKKTTDEADGSSTKMGALKTALDSVKATAKENIAAQSGLASSLGKVAVAAGGVAIALKGIKALVNNAINVAAIGDEIKDNAQKVFMGTTAYQEWGYALKQNGVEMSALKVGMRQFAQQVASGSENLAKYGITARDIDTAFQQAVFAIQNMSSETERVAAATELFGTRALELMPVLNMTNAETQNLMNSYRALGGTMSNELVAASDVCSDSILAMKTAWGGLRNLLAAYVIPIITKIVQWITVAIAYVRIFLKALFGIKETFGGKTGTSKKSIAGASASTAKSTGGTSKNLKKAAKHAKELRRTLMGIDELSRLAEKASSSSGSSGGGGGGGVGGVSVPDVGDVGSLDGIISDETLDKIQTFQDRIEKVADKIHGVYLIVKGLTEIAFGQPVQGFKDLSEGIKLLLPNIDDLKAKWDDLRQKIADKVLSAKVTLTDAFSSAWNSIKGVWNGIVNKTATTTTKLADSFSTAWNKIKDKWNGVKSKTVTLSIGLKNSLKAGWNALAKKVNAARAKGGLAKKLLPSMPYLARGGVLTEPVAAVMGEYPGARSNPEIAAPQSIMYETIQRANGDMVSAFATMTRQVIAAIENKDLDVRIGDEQIARSAQRGNNAYMNRTGKALITI